MRVARPSAPAVREPLILRKIQNRSSSSTIVGPKPKTRLFHNGDAVVERLGVHDDAVLLEEP